MATLLLAEYEGNSLKEETRRALTAALQISPPVNVLVAGENCAKAAEEAAHLEGVTEVLILEHPSLRGGLAEPISKNILILSERYDCFAAAATAFGKNILPRVAAALDVMQVSDITRILGPAHFERPIYAGNALEEVRLRTEKKVLTIRSTAFAPAPQKASPSPCNSLPVSEESLGTPTHVIEDLPESERPELSSAKIVVAGGRALGSAENFEKLILPLADRLGAAVGASRAAVDAGYAPNDWQIGQTGKVVAPTLYLAFGISGAIQHLAGMKESGVILAVNADEKAPIFDVADYGLVADVFEVLPRLLEEL